MFKNFDLRALRIALAAAPLAASLLGPARALADDASANLNVSANVEASCVISTGALAFGVYDAVSANASSPLNGSGSVQVTCTLDASASVALDEGENASSGVRRMTDGDSNFLSYSLWQDAGRSASPWADGTDAMDIIGTGANQSLTVYAQIGAGQNVPVGSYEDVVIATVTF